MHHVISGVRHGLNGSPRVLCLSPVFIRTVATASNKRWQQRQFRDSFRRAAEVQGLKSRAAFKLLEIDAKHRIFAPGQTVFDLGFAPGSWSQVAVERTKPNGRVVGLDILPCQPPKGASSIQGNFLDRAVREDAIASVRDWEYGRPRVRNFFRDKAEEEEEEEEDEVGDDDANEDEASQKDVKTQSGSKKAGATEGSSTPNDQSYIDMERQSDKEKSPEVPASINGEGTVDVVLSDMSAPWPQTSGFWKRSLSGPYYRLMDTSGIPFRDHAGSMVAFSLRFIRVWPISADWNSTGPLQCRPRLRHTDREAQGPFHLQVLSRS